MRARLSDEIGFARPEQVAGKPGMAMLALRANVPVYPVYIAGGPRTDQLLESWLLPSARGVRVTVGPSAGNA